MNEPTSTGKIGHWMFNMDGSAVCSVCGRTHNTVWDYDNADRFCRSCGSIMTDDAVVNTHQREKEPSKWKQLKTLWKLELHNLVVSR